MYQNKILYFRTCLQPWYLDGSSEHVARGMYDVKWSFPREKIGIDDSFDVTKCRQQIEMPDILYICAHSEMSNYLVCG